MIIMANAICHEEYCESVLDRADSSKMTFRDKAIIGGFILFAITGFAISIYGAFMGYYPMPIGY
jgi:hypothetical protein